MNIISYTNKGSRSKNEDYLLSEQLSHDVSFHIIADGMGGYNHGEKAAMIVAEIIFNQIRQINFSTITEENIMLPVKKLTENFKKNGQDYLQN